MSDSFTFTFLDESTGQHFELLYQGNGDPVKDAEAFAKEKGFKIVKFWVDYEFEPFHLARTDKRTDKRTNKRTKR